METRDKDYNTREGLTELIHMIGSEVKKLHSFVRGSSKIKLEIRECST